MSGIVASAKEPDIRAYVARLIFFQNALQNHPEMAFLERQMEEAKAGIIAEAIKMYSPRRSA